MYMQRFSQRERARFNLNNVTLFILHANIADKHVYVCPCSRSLMPRCVLRLGYLINARFHHRSIPETLSLCYHDDRWTNRTVLPNMSFRHQGMHSSSAPKQVLRADIYNARRLEPGVIFSFLPGHH